MIIQLKDNWHLQTGCTLPLIVVGLLVPFVRWLTQADWTIKSNRLSMGRVQGLLFDATLKRSSTWSRKVVTENAFLRLWDGERGSLLDARRTRKEDKCVTLMDKDVFSTAGILQLVKDAVKKGPWEKKVYRMQNGGSHARIRWKKRIKIQGQVLGSQAVTLNIQSLLDFLSWIAWKSFALPLPLHFSFHHVNHETTFWWANSWTVIYFI
jgi:hypothetical protein